MNVENVEISEVKLVEKILKVSFYVNNYKDRVEFILMFYRDEDNRYGYSVYYEENYESEPFYLYGSSRRAGQESLFEAIREAKQELLGSIDDDKAKQYITDQFFAFIR